MTNPVRVTVFARLDCCVPDFTGKNKVLVEMLHQMREQMSSLVKIEVVPNASREERFVYYKRMVTALLAGKDELPVLKGAGNLTALHHELSALKAGTFLSPAALEKLREVSSILFWIPPVIALDGKAVFAGKVPSATELCEAIKRASCTKDGANENR